MADELDIFINKIKELSIELPALVTQAAKNVEAELADLNVSQMNEGILSTGGKITPQYSNAYANFKGFKTPNLKLEGDFHSGVFADAKTDYIEFDSTDYKTEKLEDKYSSNIFGIAPKNEQKQADLEDPYLLILIDKKLTR